MNLRLPQTDIERCRTCATLIGLGGGASAFIRRAYRMECDRIAATKPKAPFFIDPADLAQNPVILNEEEMHDEQG